MHCIKIYIFSLGFNPERNSFITIAENLFPFNEVNALPSNLRRRIEIYDSFENLSKKFMEQCAVFHKSCISNYNKQKLLRKRKLQDSFPAPGEDNTCEDEEDSSKVLSKRTTRKSLTLRNFQSTCFFCDQVDDKSNLHKCQTIATSTRVKRIAVELPDTKLIAKLSEGDMIATEAKYHGTCLAGLYNRYRDANKPTNRSNDIDLLEGISFIFLVYISFQCSVE